MRAITRLVASLAFAFICFSTALGQTNPPPPDPHEMVTREPKLLSKTTDRSAAIDFLGRARKNFDFRDAGVPYDLKVSFETNGSSKLEGSGTMEEFYDGHSQYRWNAQLNGVKVTRVGTNDRVYGTNPSEPVPLRIQLIRTVLLHPLLHNIANFEIRAADVERDGKHLACFLLSHSLPPNPAPRAWVEREDCIDSDTTLLRTWSVAPGIYAIYDYEGSDFHGYTLPRQVSIYEEGRLTVQIHVDSLTDAPNLDAKIFQPSEEMGETAETFNLTGAERNGPLRVDPDGPASRFYQPVIVHAILDAQDGSVLDAETLQDSSDELGRAALDLVRGSSFDPTGFQQELFINVQFHFPATAFGGPQLSIYRSARVHWTRVDWHGWHPKAPPARPHGGK
jgi:hypothetical protein